MKFFNRRLFMYTALAVVIGAWTSVQTDVTLFDMDVDFLWFLFKG